MRTAAGYIALACALFTIGHANDAAGQASCSQRYIAPVFSSLDTSANVTYGRSTAVTGVSQALLCDIYQPAGDTAKRRPLIVFVHGGTFVAGDKNEPDIVRLCRAFASRGYVCASINYRLGLAGYSGVELARANIRAVQDARAAVRFFRSRADSLRIDTSLIFEGGTSAGGFTAIQHAYLDQSEIPPAMDTTGLGSLEGASGTPGYSSRIRGVINLWGAIGDTSWIHTGDLPIVSIHGTADITVPYNAGWVFGVQGLYWVYGSEAINLRARHQGVYSTCALFGGMAHQFPVSSPQMDTAETVIADFLGAVINCDSGKAAVSVPAVLRGRAQLPLALVSFDRRGAVLSGTVSARTRVFDCAGKQVGSRVTEHNGRTLLYISAAVPGTYLVVDADNKSARAVPLLSARN